MKIEEGPDQGIRWIHRHGPLLEAFVMRGSRRGGGQGVRTPSEKSRNIGFLCSTVPIPPKNHKATKPAFNVGHHRPATETPFQWRFAGGPAMVAHL